MAYDAAQERYEVITLFGQTVLFTDSRIKPDTVPKGMYLYEVRHADENPFDPCQIGKGIWANHFGTVITNQPIRVEPSPVTGNAYRDFDAKTDWNYKGEYSTLQEYMQEHPPKNKEKSHER